MHIKLHPKQPTYKIPQFPHCDSRVLHAPGECEYCDAHPEWQALRIAWGIAFTGYTPDVGETPCPAERMRPLDTIEKWGGNKPWPKDTTGGPTISVPPRHGSSTLPFTGGSPTGSWFGCEPGETHDVSGSWLRYWRSKLPVADATGTP